MEPELYDTYDIAGTYLPALINEDWSGLDEDETCRLRRFVDGVEARAARDGLTHLTWNTECDCDPYYATDAVSGLKADCSEVSVHSWDIRNNGRTGQDA